MAVTGSADMVNAAAEVFYNMIWRRSSLLVDLFNQQTGGAIQLSVENVTSATPINTFVKNISDLVYRRPLGDYSALPQVAMAEAGYSAALCDWTTKSVGFDIDAFSRTGRDGDLSRMISIAAEQISEQWVKYMADFALASIVAVLEKNLPSAGTGPVSIVGNADPLLSRYTEGIVLMGRFLEGRNRIVNMIGTTESHQQVGESIVKAALGTETGVNLVTGSMRGRNGWTLTEMNASVLTVAGTPNYHRVIYLKPGAVVVRATGMPAFLTEDKNQLMNPTRAVRTLGRFSVEIPGYDWDKTGAGDNPALATIGSGVNWNTIIDRDEDVPGMILHTETGFRSEAVA